MIHSQKQFSPQTNLFLFNLVLIGVQFVKIDVDTDADLADQFKIDKLPTFLLFKDREIVDCIVGAESLNHFKTKLNEVVE